MDLYDFRTEHLVDPAGLSVKNPRFSWKISSTEKNVVQTGYRLQVFCGERMVWDSGRVESSQSVLVP